ncbi:ABC transporter permease [Vagococcus penaei]|uniref:ABC transporter permease n=1 Tax=Vagococcus penaei TaxID=633807 RepID=UPI001B86D066|nr:ABC transporter permease [Vagococcus penaei]
MANSQLFMGHMTSQTPIFLVGALGILMVFLINSLYVNHLLNRFRKLSAVDALRFGQVPVRFKKRQRVYVTQSSVVPTTVYLGIKDIFAQKRLYVTLLFVMIMALFMMIVPQNLKHTIASKEFVTYMGIGDSDIRIDLQQINDIPDRATKISQSLAQDSRVDKQTVLTTKMLKTKGSNGLDERLKVELGNHQVFPLTYAEGKAPQKEHEIALSVISAEELGKKVGDTLTLVVDNQAREMVVCGTYSDITNGGKTAKAAFTTSSDDTMWSVIYVNLVDKELIEELTIDYTQQFPFAKTTSINKFIQQTFQSTIHSVNRAAYIGGMIAILITLLVTTLFTRLLISQETPTIGALKALGFTTTDIIKQYLTRTVFIAIIALVSGVVLANILGERLIGLVIGSFGASAFDLSIQPVMTYLIGPLIILCSVVIATLLGTLSIKQIKICESMRE